ncbi:hypothetical protein AA309_31305 [Microvirga vignae]|uniref:Uncharacterized protein n=2 Tax=Microvirga vignae TaxID=1225564 RepID=A0A0H1R3T0_9HYPH|nr:hypothetical protein AA309_31305 [Microvirga vignae]
MKVTIMADVALICLGSRRWLPKGSTARAKDNVMSHFSSLDAPAVTIPLLQQWARDGQRLVEAYKDIALVIPALRELHDVTRYDRLE